MCIIAAVPTPNGPCLVKNRDRSYLPDLRLYNGVIAGKEVAVVTDLLTEWLEGINEAGIAIVNSALMVIADEKAGADAEGAAKDLAKQKKTTKSQDGARILRALKFEDIDDVLESLVTFREGINGHTFVATPDSLYVIEKTTKYPAIVKKLDAGKIHVRTNHGHFHPDTGYQGGEKLKSSKIRNRLARLVLNGKTRPEELIKALNTTIFEEDSPFNMVRRTDLMKSSSQIVLRPHELDLYFHVIKDQVQSFMSVDIRPDKGKSKPKIPGTLIEL